MIPQLPSTPRGLEPGLYISPAFYEIFPSTAFKKSFRSLFEFIFLLAFRMFLPLLMNSQTDTSLLCNPTPANVCARIFANNRPMMTPHFFFLFFFHHLPSCCKIATKAHAYLYLSPTLLHTNMHALEQLGITAKVITTHAACQSLLQ
jgi:hypothetical protein